MEKVKVYFAAPVVVNDVETFGQIGDVKHRLALAFGANLYVPSEHKVPNEWGIPRQMWGQCVFTMDVQALDKCDWVVMCNFGRHATAGTAWEVGYAFAKGKKILVVDMPGMEETSLMVEGCASNVVSFDAFMCGAPLGDSNEAVTRLFVERGRIPESKEYH